MARPRKGITPEQLLASYPLEIKSLTDWVRQLVRNTLPEAEERAYPGWCAIGYRHPEAGYIGAIFLHPHKVKLGFEHGAKLPDPDGLLKPGPSAVKQVRYLEIVEEGDVDTSVIRQLVEAAVELGHDF